MRSGMALVCVFSVLLGASVATLAQPKAEEKKADKLAPPDESKLYVWGQPEKGTQSMLVLRAIDGDRVEAAFLVPVTVHLNYRGGGKATAEQVEQAAGGRLLPFDLKGRDRFGRLTGDAYLGKEGGGWLTEAAPKVKVEKTPKK